MLTPRAKHLIKKEIRGNYSSIVLALATKTLDVRRRNISRVVFYPDIKLAYNRIGKSGNSSVVLYLSDALQGKQNETSNYKESKKDAIDLGVDLIQLSRDWRKILCLHQYSFFTVVRNPWSRTLSAFLDKIADGLNKKYDFVDGFGDNSARGFEAFVSFLAQGGLQTNHHWRPQNEILLLPASRFSHICRLEHLAHDLPLALKSTGLTLPPKDRLQKPHRIESGQQGKVTNASDRLTSYYTPQTARRIYQLFQDDFELGRYSNDPRSVGLR